eukprot:5262058-Pyramimonas_sp.AAC.1
MTLVPFTVDIRVERPAAKPFFAVQEGPFRSDRENKYFLRLAKDSCERTGHLGRQGALPAN